MDNHSEYWSKILNYVDRSQLKFFQFEPWNPFFQHRGSLEKCPVWHSVWWFQLHLTSSNISQNLQANKCLSIKFSKKENYMYCIYLDLTFNLLTSSIESHLTASSFPNFTPWNMWVEHQDLASVDTQGFGCWWASWLKTKCGCSRLYIPITDPWYIYLLLWLMANEGKHSSPTDSMGFPHWLPLDYINLWKEILPSENSE